MILNTKKHLRYELAKVYDRLAMIYAWKFEFAKQETTLLRASEQWAALIQQQPFPGYVAAAAFSQLMMCELYTHTGRIQESIELGKQAIGQLEALHQSNPDDSELALAFADALTRFNIAFSEVLPMDESHGHRLKASKILESMPGASDKSSAVLGQWLDDSDSLQLPFTSLRDALAECQVNLAFLVPDLRQAEEFLGTALEELADAEVTDSDAGRCVSLLARAEQVLGLRLSNSGTERQAEAELHLARAVALFQQLAAEFPQMVAYRAGLTFTLSQLAQPKYRAAISRRENCM